MFRILLECLIGSKWLDLHPSVSGKQIKNKSTILEFIFKISSTIIKWFFHWYHIVFKVKISTDLCRVMIFSV